MLGKGDACITCRRDKLKCNGSKPICSRCQRLRKGCRYANGRAKRQSMTALLEGRALELETKVNKLVLAATHDLSLASQRLLHRAEYLGAMNREQPIHATWLPMYPHIEDSTHGSERAGPIGQILRYDTTEGYSPVVERAAIELDLDSYRWENGDEVPYELSRTLIGLFLPYRSRFHFFMDVPYFLHHLSLPTSHPESIHPCLRNACYLAACSTTGGRFTSLQPYFVSRTRHFLEEALMFADRIPHFLWASMILACYLGRTRRLNEAFVVMSAAAPFASACGLTRNSARDTESQFQPVECLLRPPRDEAETIDRMRLARSIYLTDQVQAAMCRFRGTLTCDDRWIIDSQETRSAYEDNESPKTIQRETGETWQSDVHLKASTAKLFERVTDFTLSVYEHRSDDDEEDYESLRSQILLHESFIPSLDEPLGLDPSETTGTSNPHIFLAQVTLYGSGLVLYSLRSGKDPDARSQMIRSARALVDVCRKVRGRERLHSIHACLPALRHVMSATRVLVHEVRAPDVRESPALSTDYCEAIESLLDFLDDMTMWYPAWARFPGILKDDLLHALSGLT
ncbi:hypothetical protein DL93DRAFT_2233695 [Clavulina sp. PMI_390]|nr:hypothetical protein DL93DRAFT_2233695 [Clavulina sp. PMI_390]